VIGQAAVFDGVDDFFGCGQDAAFVGLQALTLSMWVEIEERAGVDQYVMISNLGTYQASGGYQMRLGALPDPVTVTFRDDAHVDQRATGTTPVEGAAWRHLAASLQVDGATTTVKTYSDGALDNTQEIPGAINYDDVFDLTIGSNIDGAAGSGSYDREFQGSLDDLRLYDQVLGDAEVQALFELGG